MGTDLFGRRGCGWRAQGSTATDVPVRPDDGGER